MIVMGMTVSELPRQLFTCIWTWMGGANVLGGVKPGREELFLQLHTQTGL